MLPLMNSFSLSADPFAALVKGISCCSESNQTYLPRSVAAVLE